VIGAQRFVVQHLERVHLIEVEMRIHERFRHEAIPRVDLKRCMKGRRTIDRSDPAGVDGDTHRSHAQTQHGIPDQDIGVIHRRLGVIPSSARPSSGGDTVAA